MLTEALEITEKEGIEVEGEEVAEKARRRRKSSKNTGDPDSKNAIAQQHSQRSQK
jgi:hypothetical protein